MKAIVESFEGSGILVTQARVSLLTTGLATQLLKIKNQYECLIKLIDTMKSAKYTIKEAEQAIQGLDCIETLAALNITLQKMKSNDISKIMSMERPDILPAVHSSLQYSLLTTASVERSKEQKLLGSKM